MARLIRTARKGMGGPSRYRSNQVDIDGVPSSLDLVILVVQLLRTCRLVTLVDFSELCYIGKLVMIIVSLCCFILLPVGDLVVVGMVSHSSVHACLDFYHIYLLLVAPSLRLSHHCCCYCNLCLD